MSPNVICCEKAFYHKRQNRERRGLVGLAGPCFAFLSPGQLVSLFEPFYDYTQEDKTGQKGYDVVKLQHNVSCWNSVFEFLKCHEENMGAMGLIIVSPFAGRQSADADYRPRASGDWGGIPDMETKQTWTMWNIAGSPGFLVSDPSKIGHNFPDRCQFGNMSSPQIHRSSGELYAKRFLNSLPESQQHATRQIRMRKMNRCWRSR